MRLCGETRQLSPIGTVLVVLGLTTLVSAQQPSGSRIQKKTYDFKEAKKEMEYALFVPSTYDKQKKAPLVVALHGMGGNPQQMMRSRGLTEQAEKYGYLVVAPMGYNSSGWYGARSPGGSGRPGGFSGSSTTPGTVLPTRLKEGLNLTEEQQKKIEALQKEVDATLKQVLTEEQQKKLKESPGRGIGGGQDAPANLGELSEKDVMNVLAIIRKEFNVDDRRIYLIGHSMGGAGTWHLGTKYADVWAGLAPIAPAAFGQPTGLDKLKNVPVIVVQGDADTVTRPEGARRWVAKLKELNLTHEYLEIAGADHGSVISRGMPKVFEFFEKQQKK